MNFKYFSRQIWKNCNGPCPYLPDRQWETKSFNNQSVTAEEYSRLMDSGFRRAGSIYYQNHCSGCQACIPLRVDCSAFAYSNSQKRVWQKNIDLRWSLIDKPIFSQELFSLYQDYLERKHLNKSAGKAELNFNSNNTLDNTDFFEYLVVGPDFFKLIEYRLEGQLVAASWVDILPNGISSVYTAYSLNHSKRSFGIYSALFEIELAKELGLNWYYLGFLVADNPKMAYKSQFRPHQLLTPAGWR